MGKLVPVGFDKLAIEASIWIIHWDNSLYCREVQEDSVKVDRHFIPCYASVNEVIQSNEVAIHWIVGVDEWERVYLVDEEVSEKEVPAII